VDSHPHARQQRWLLMLTTTFLAIILLVMLMLAFSSRVKMSRAPDTISVRYTFILRILRPHIWNSKTYENRGLTSDVFASLPNSCSGGFWYGADLSHWKFTAYRV